MVNRRQFIEKAIGFGLVSAAGLLHLQSWSEYAVEVVFIPDHNQKTGSYLAYQCYTGRSPIEVPRKIQTHDEAMRWARNYFNNPDSPGFIK